MMRTILRNRAISSLAAGGLLLGGVGLVAGGVLPVPLDALTTSHAESPDDHGPPDDVPRGDVDAADDDDPSTQNGDDGPDENASQTARDVHEARAQALALGDDAPPCAIGVYVSSAARGDWDPFDENDDPPATEDMPCAEGEGDASATAEGDDDDDADVEGDDDAGDEGEGGPPDDAGSQGDVDGDGSPGRSGAGGPPEG